MLRVLRPTWDSVRFGGVDRDRAPDDPELFWDRVEVLVPLLRVPAELLRLLPDELELRAELLRDGGGALRALDDEPPLEADELCFSTI